MATHDYVIANGTGVAVRSDLNDALAAIVSQNSNATAPATTYAYMPWADTTAGVMKIRNGANSAWITLYQLDGEYTTIAIENGTAAAPAFYFKDSGTDTGIYSPGTDQVGISAGGTLRFSISTTAVSSSLAIDHPLGAVGTPSITFTGDLNTGIYSPAADQIGISTGGTLRLSISTTAVSSTLAIDHPLGAVGTPSITFTGDLNTGFWSPAADTVAVSTGGSERVRVTSAGELLVGTTTTTANGGKLQVSNGITFPATQVACSDVNTLDDYEEGTFTPTVAGTTSAGTGTYQAQVGRYTKTGNRVFFTVYLRWNAHTGTGNLDVRGLPFNTINSSGANHSVFGYHQDIALSANSVLNCYVRINDTSIAVGQIATGGGTTAAVPMDSAGELMFTGVYETTS